MTKALGAVGAAAVLDRRPATARRGEIAADAGAWGDVVLSRSDAPSSYHLSVVVDDAAAGRHPCGARPRPLPRDLRPPRCCRRCSTCPQPLYHHHRLITDADGRKLSKSNGDTGLAAFRAGGLSAAPISAAFSGFERLLPRIDR